MILTFDLCFLFFFKENKKIKDKSASSSLTYFPCSKLLSPYASTILLRDSVLRQNEGICIQKKEKGYKKALNKVRKKSVHH